MYQVWVDKILWAQKTTRADASEVKKMLEGQGASNVRVVKIKAATSYEKRQRRLARKAGPVSHVKRNPLKKGFTPKTIGENISHEVKRGKPHAQAIKIAYGIARREFKQRHPNEPLPEYLQDFDAFKKNPMKIPARGLDEGAIRELDLYADNTAVLQPQKEAIIKNLLKKMKAGKYQHSFAPDLWLYWYNNAAKKYAQEFATPSEWSKLFPIKERVEAAHHRADEEYRKMVNGEYSHILPLIGAQLEYKHAIGLRKNPAKKVRSTKIPGHYYVGFIQVGKRGRKYTNYYLDSNGDFNADITQAIKFSEDEANKKRAKLQERYRKWVSVWFKAI